MKYKCLVLDHDDTVVDSTASIHYPAFLEALKELRPGESVTSDDYFRFNFTPGFLPYCKDVLKMTDDELAVELEIWKSYVEKYIPKAYPGIKEIIERFKAEGGKVCVISHSFDFNIKRDYEANELPLPDMIFGWECPPEQRKPNTYPLKKICDTYGFEPIDLVMVDDLKPGHDMCKEFGVPFVGAGWSNDIFEIRDFMSKNSDFYFTKVEELSKFLFD